jgi:murein peptide amidase A
MWRRAVLGGLAVLLVGAAPARAEVIGRSVDGRAITAVRVGPADASRAVVVVGCVHGTERAGEAITRRLRGARVPVGAAVWLIDQANPDGCRAGTRGNAHGVDLNRNAPWHWRGTGPPGSTYYAGPRAASEPETRALLAFLARVRPAVTIWYHQHAALVDDPGAGHRGPARTYARAVGLPFRAFGRGLPGIFTGWENARQRDGAAFVVELPAGALSAAAVRRHALAVLDVARPAH